jgi:hypothetical protein
MTIVDEYTVHITGSVNPQGSTPRRQPISSQYDLPRKAFAGHAHNWSREFHLLNITEKDAIGEAEKAADVIKVLEKEVKELRKQLGARERTQTQASRSKIKLLGSPEAYQTLKKARAAVRDIRCQVVPKEAKLRVARQELYYWNNIVKASKVKEAEKEMKKAVKEIERDKSKVCVKFP